MEGAPNIQQPEGSKTNGPVVGIIVVIIVLAIGAYYLYAELQSQKMAREQDAAAFEQEMTDEQAVESIEGDLSEEDLDALEAELNADMQALEAEAGTL